MHNHPQASIEKSSIGRLFSASWNKSARFDIDLKGSQCTALYPTNPLFYKMISSFPHPITYELSAPETCSSTAQEQTASLVFSFRTSHCFSLSMTIVHAKGHYEIMRSPQKLPRKLRKEKAFHRLTLTELFCKIAANLFWLLRQPDMEMTQ
jgi:hypothetical protein